MLMLVNMANTSDYAYSMYVAIRTVHRYTVCMYVMYYSETSLIRHSAGNSVVTALAIHARYITLSLQTIRYTNHRYFMSQYWYSQTSLVSTPGDPPNCYALSIVLANHIRRLVLWVISWGIISSYFLTRYYSLTVFLLTRSYCTSLQ